MNRWTKFLLGMGATVLLGSCAQGNSYPAPYGTNLIVLPGEISLSGPSVMLFEALVEDPNRGEDGMLLNNIEVSVKSYVPGGFILIPEFAITAYTNEDFCADGNGNGVDDCTEEAEYYYQWENVDTGGVDPDFLRTVTDSHGVARIYIYAKCFPTECGTTCDDDYDPEECEPRDATVVFSTAVDSETVVFTAEAG